MGIDKDDRCYICGRTNEEVLAYLVSSLRRQVQLDIKKFTDRRDTMQGQLAKSSETRKKIKSITEVLDPYILRLKLSTIENDLATFAEEHPELSELMKLLNTTGRGRKDQTLSEAAEYAVNTRPPEEEKQLHRIDEMKNEIRYLEDLIEYQKHSMEALGRRFISEKGYRDHPFRQQSSSLVDADEQLRRIAKDLSLDFDSTYALADAIKQGMKRQGKNQTAPLEERWSEIHESISAPPKILAMLTIDIYRRFTSRAIESLPRIDDGRRQYFSRDKDQRIPICSICDQLTRTPHG